jgi:hypothetical protein
MATINHVIDYNANCITTKNFFSVFSTNQGTFRQSGYVASYALGEGRTGAHWFKTKREAREWLRIKGIIGYIK